jgi:hypothetical protein
MAGGLSTSRLRCLPFLRRYARLIHDLQLSKTHDWWQTTQQRELTRAVCAHVTDNLTVTSRDVGTRCPYPKSYRREDGGIPYPGNVCLSVYNTSLIAPLWEPGDEAERLRVIDVFHKLAQLEPELRRGGAATFEGPHAEVQGYLPCPVGASC